MSKPPYADSLGFLAPPGELPIWKERPELSLVHLTSVPPTPAMQGFDATLVAHEEFVRVALSNPSTHMVLTKKDIAKTGDSMGLLFGLQHAPNELSRERVQALFNAGVRVMTLCYSGAGEYGRGHDVIGGLTRRGIDLLHWMNEVGIILDLSHANRQTALDALEHIGDCGLNLPVMASHSGYKRVHRDSRNIGWLVAHLIVSFDGYIGIPAMNFMLGAEESNHLEAFLHHVFGIISEWGTMHIGIGSDCPHVDMTMEEARANYDRMLGLGVKVPYGLYFPDRPEPIIEHGSALFGQFETLFKKYGHPPAEVLEGILGSNFEQFLIRSLPQT